MPKTVDGNVVYDCSPDEFVRYIPEMIAAGVRVFGGCCGTDASHIRALSSVLKSAELPEKDRHDEIFLSVEREVFLLGKGAAPERFIPCGEDLRADASGFEKNVIMGIDLDDADISELEAVQWRFKNPVCFRSSEPAILEAALRVFQGRAAYTGPLSAEELDPLVRSYGLVVI
jgi:5-methyltetrahydrofolate--homocysteine methyltransferase